MTQKSTNSKHVAVDAAEEVLLRPDANYPFLPRVAVLVRYMLSSCVCPTVCHKLSSTKVAKPRISQTVPYYSQGTLVF